MKGSNTPIVVIATFAALACNAQKQSSTGNKGQRTAAVPRPQGRKAPAARAGAHRGPPHRRLIRALDADGDGQISADEINNAPAALRTLDRNKDGRLTADEIGRRPHFHGRRRRHGRSRWSRTDPKPKDAAEKKILNVLSDIERNRSIGMMNVPLEDGRLLRLLAEAVGAKHVVEIGTSNGYSAIWFCLALRKTGGRLTTHEIDKGRAAQARKNFKQAGVDNLVTLVLGDAHKTVKKIKGPIDVVFIDAEKEGYADYLKQLLPLVRPGGLVLAHNTARAGPGIEAYLKAATGDPNLETLLLHMDGPGISVTLKKQ